MDILKASGLDITAEYIEVPHENVSDDELQDVAGGGGIDSGGINSNGTVYA